MDRNVESHFQELPKAKVQRSIFRQPHDIKTSFNAGELIPFLCKEVLPGDTFQPVTAKVVRCQTMLTPIMDNMYLDTLLFFRAEPDLSGSIGKNFVVKTRNPPGHPPRNTKFRLSSPFCGVIMLPPTPPVELTILPLKSSKA